MNIGFRYYPEKLYSKPVSILNGVQAIKGFGMSKPIEIFYSTQDGNFNDISIWETVSGRGGKLPTGSDDVYIRHSVTVNANSAVNNLFISAQLLFDTTTRVLSILGNIQCTGVVNLSGASHLLDLYGIRNYINPKLFNKGTSGNVRYLRSGEQDVIGLNYQNLTIAGTGFKTLIDNINVSGSLTLNTNGLLDFYRYDATISGTTNLNNGAQLIKSSAGNVVFGGVLNQNFGTVNFSGNPSVECKGGITTYGGSFTSGNNQWKFSTNNQSIDCPLGAGSSAITTFNCPVLISGAITLKITGSAGAGMNMALNDVVNGDNAASTLRNECIIRFNNVGSTVIMTTGVIVVDPSTANTFAALHYNFNGDYTIPYTSINGLIINGTGTKSLSANTVLNKSIILNSPSIFDTVGYDLTVGATTSNAPGATFISSSFSNLLFIGSFAPVGIVDLSGGNPNIEFRGGIAIAGTPVLKFGTGVKTFTTNNQSINSQATASIYSIPGAINISGAIILTVSFSGVSFALTLLGVLNGNNASSTLDNRADLSYQNGTQPMLTGVLTTNSFANTFRYNQTGNQDVKGGTYRIIEFGGSGVKTLQGNVIVNVTAGGSQSTTGTATVNLNGYTITTI